MSLSDSSELSSPPSSDGEKYIDSPPKGGIAKFFLKPKPKLSADTRDDSPPRKKRSPSPPHEYGLADNPDVAFIIMFRSRFHDVFPASSFSFGPQDLERDAVEPVPGERIENLLCALLGLVLNRKKYVERSHYQRALEEAVHTNASQWPRSWDGKNALRGGKTFASMDAPERLHLMKTLIIWALSSSDAIQAVIKESYKQARRDDDLNQPLSVQPWGQDGDRRRYWLIEGRDDTEFRLYRESNTKLKHHDWRAVAGTIEELKSVSDRLKEEGSQAARRLSDRITLAVPRLEASLQKRKQREYRLARKAQFARPEPGASLYEGRTRGKKLKYTFSSEEEDSDVRPTRRTNGRSGKSTPSEGADGPVFTASGRQVRSRIGGVYGESMLSGRNPGNTVTAARTTEGPETTEEQQEPSGRPRRTGLRQSISTWSGGRDHIPGYNEVDEMEEEEDAESSGVDEYVGDGGNDDANEDTAAEDMSNDPSDMDDVDVAPNHNQKLLVQLRYQKAVQAAAETTLDGRAVPSAQAAMDLDKRPIPPLSNDEAHNQQSISIDRPSTPKEVPSTIQPGTEVPKAS